ncbi:out at first protein [Folsomia candida]|uniref:out at first protein n=1 Tax=Folsomia candida TaxID=158441 RepID=UPI000B8F9760|nr:out at first protein [Folsomia candida]
MTVSSYWTRLGILLCTIIIKDASLDLVVNVRNQGGDIYKEEILSDVNEETINLSFESPGDGSTVLLFIDFKNEIQIIQTDVLGEEELTGDPPFMSYCFVTKFIKGDFIPPDAMTKLRQKNPWSIRIPERQLSLSSSESDATHPNSTLDSLLATGKHSDWISPHLKTICKESVTYVNKLDLMSNFHENGNNSESFLRAVRPVIIATSDCSTVTRASGVPCLCSHPVCVGWFPCALKYCRNKGDTGGTVKTYRCGIHTCKSCRNYLFPVNNRFNCL